MATCETCGNNYDDMLEITRGGETHQFDCFECAIQALAPTCANCGTRIIGHGLTDGHDDFCCAHCARQMGHDEFVDRA